jgi:hypothetical protein
VLATALAFVALSGYDASDAVEMFVGNDGPVAEKCEIHFDGALSSESVEAVTRFTEIPKGCSVTINLRGVDMSSGAAVSSSTTLPGRPPQ